MSFEDNLREGLAGETAIAKWLTDRGHVVLPAYEKLIGDYKGPRIYRNGRPLIAPDMVAFRGSNPVFVEAKQKSGFAFNRTFGVYVTGIDLRCWNDYMELRSITDIPIWLLFLHTGKPVKDSPVTPPGLWGNELLKLREAIGRRGSHFSHKSKMVYWAKEALRDLTPYWEKDGREMRPEERE